MTTEVVAVALREARPVDVPVLELLIAQSARALSRPDYTDAQIEAALGTAWEGVAVMRKGRLDG